MENPQGFVTVHGPGRRPCHRGDCPWEAAGGRGGFTDTQIAFAEKLAEGQAG